MKKGEDEGERADGREGKRKGKKMEGRKRGGWKEKRGWRGRRGRDGGRGLPREGGRDWGKVVVDEEAGLVEVIASEGPSGGPVM